MKKLRIVSIIFFALGLLSFLIFWMIGSEVNSDGTLVEPFFLIPLGYFLIFIGIILGIVFIFKKK